MNKDYLKRVMLFLKQEIPDLAEFIKLKENKLILIVPADTAFQPFYEDVLKKITDSTNKRRRDEDIPFCVWSPNQERDFMIRK
jgi:hypothetical protein